MKYIIRILLLVIICLPAFAQQKLIKSPAVNTTVYESIHSGTVVYEGNKNFPPYEFINEDGEPDGFNIDLIKVILQRMNCRYDIRMKDFASVLSDIKEGKADIAGMMYTTKRTLTYKFGALIKYETLFAVYTKNGQVFNTIQDFNGKRIVVEKGTASHEQILTDSVKCQLFTVNHLRDALIRLSKGEFDALLCDNEAAEFYISQCKLHNLLVKDIDITPLELCFAGMDENLLDDIEKEFFKVRKDGTYDIIYDKWFSRKTPSQAYKVAYIAAGILLLAVAILYILIHLLRKRVFDTKKQLAEKNHRLGLVLEAGGLIVWGFNVKRKLFYNIECTLYPSGGRPLEDELKYIHPDDQTRYRKTLESASRGTLPEGPICFRLDYTKTNRWRYFEEIITVMRAKDGSVIDIIGTMKDVSELMETRKKELQAIRKIEFAIQTGGMVFWEYDSETGSFFSFNDPYNPFESSIPLKLDGFVKHLHPDDVNLFIQSINYIYKGENHSFKVDVRVKLEEETEWHYQTVTGAPLDVNPETGLVNKYVGLWKDNTDLVKLNNKVSEYAQRINYVLLASNTLTWFYDVESNEMTFYKGGDKLICSFTKEEYIEKCSQEDRESVKRNFELIAENKLGNVREQRKIAFIQDTEVDSYYVMNGSPITNEAGKIITFFGICNDVTDLINTQHQLEKETKKAQRADGLKTEFLANMSHEIRTPLNAIVGFSNLLDSVEDKAQRTEFVDIINKNSDQLLNLISDILDFSKMESGTMELQITEFNLSELFEAVYASFANLVKERNIELRCVLPPKPCIIQADYSRTVQLLTNFITNAFKYTEKGYIEMSYQSVNKGVKLMVKDTGIGIPPKMKEKIFDRFSQLDSNKQGVGLGLAICKAIADMYDGQIGVESEEGKGSTFWVVLPCKKKD